MSRPTARITRRALAAGLAAAPLAACGIKGPNRRPPDADPAYPRTYPPPESVVPEGRRAPEPEAESSPETPAGSGEGGQDGQ